MYSSVFWCEFIDLVAFLALSWNPVTPFVLWLALQKNVQRVLVLNLVEISKDFLIFIDFKMAETGFDSKPVGYFLINILLVLSMPRAFEHSKLCAHLLSSYEYLISLSILVIIRAVIKRRGPGISPSYCERLPRLLSKENERKIEPKEIPSCLIPRLLVVFTRQLEILVTTLHCTSCIHCML